jgi:hypothetical protein
MDFPTLENTGGRGLCCATRIYKEARPRARFLHLFGCVLRQWPDAKSGRGNDQARLSQDAGIRCG